jgi:hypothetical protein
MKKFLFALTVVFAASWLGVPAPAAAQESGVAPGADAGPAALTVLPACAAKTLHVKVDDGINYGTTSGAFVNVPNSNITFKIGGLNASCAVVTFQAFTFAAGAAELMYVRALLDGAVMQPGEVQFSGDDSEDGDGAWARTHSATWIAPGVPPGVHTVQIQFRSGLGGSVFVHKPSTQVRSK